MSLPSSSSSSLALADLELDRSEPAKEARSEARSMAELALPGRIIELAGQACTTSAVAILAHAQREGETVAWIQPARGDLYPPDLAEAGVDLDALIVVHVPAAEGPHGQCRAAELLLRSGGFGLVVLDFMRAEPSGSAAWQGRLLGLARQHESRVVVLRDAEPDQPSLGPLIGLRIGSRVESVAREGEPPGFVARTGQFAIIHEVLKNKSGGPLAPRPEIRRGPWGLR